MNLRDIANKIGSYISNKTQDNQGFIQQGHLTAKPITQAIQNISNFRVGTNPTLGQATQQVFSQLTPKTALPFPRIAENINNNAFLRGGADIVNQGLKSFVNMGTLGLVQPQMGERQTPVGLVGTVGGGIGGFAVNPLGKTISLTDKLVSKVAPKAVGTVAKVSRGLGSEALQTLGYAGASTLGSKLGLNKQTGQFRPENLASNLALGSVLRGTGNLAGVKVKGMFKNAKTIDEKTAAEIGRLVDKSKVGFKVKGVIDNQALKDVDVLTKKFIGSVPKNYTYTDKIKLLEKTADYQNIPNFLNMGIVGKSQLEPKIEGKIKIKPNEDLVTKFNDRIKIKEPELKQRGFSASVQQAPNVSKQTKIKITGAYEAKPNEQLMGEAKALLNEGASIDFKNTKDLDKKVAATIQEALNQQKAGNHQVAADLFNNLSEHGTELGRGVQAFSLLQNMSPESIALSAAGQIKKYNRLNPTRTIPELTGEQTKLIADKVQALDLLKGREKNIALNEINQLINSFIPSRLSDKAIAVWKAGLLTSLRTHERNFVSNAIHGSMEVLKDIPATGADIILSAKTGKRTITPTLKGLGEFGSKTTQQQMADIFSKGFDPSEQINKFDYKAINWGDNLIERGLKKYTDVIFRSLGASDKPFYNAALSRSLYSQAGAEAINAGKRGNKQFIENLVKNPTEDMMKIAIGDANISTFKDRNKASVVVSQLKQAMGKNEGSKILGEITMPFTGVPTSVLGQIINYSPVGLLKGIKDSGKVLAGQVPELQRQATQEIGRGVIGTGIFGLGSYLASKGLITGQPKDATEQRQWDLENKPRNSIMIGGKWRSLNSIGPEAVVFLAGSKLNEELGSEGNLGTYGVKLGKDYLDQSFVTGLQGPVNAITDPNRYAKSYLGNQLSSVIPNIVKDFSKATDTQQREANTVLDYAKQGIPFARQTLTEKRDVLGNVMPQEPTGIGAFIDMFNSKTPVDNMVVNELSRLNKVGENATPSKMTANQTILKQKVKLTFDQLNQLEAGVGEQLRPKLQTLISSPVYQQLTDEKKAKAIDDLVSKTREQYKNLNANKIIGGQISPIKITPIAEPKYTGNATIDKKLKTQYENAIEKQQVESAGIQPQISNPDMVYDYIDEDGNYKTIDLTPVQYPKLTGNTTVDKKLKSSYYSDINAQINGVIKLGQAGQITEDEMIAMVTKLNEQYTAGKGGKKPKKVTFKVSKTEIPKLNIKFQSPKTSTIKLKSAPKVKMTTSNQRRYTIKA